MNEPYRDDPHHDDDLQLARAAAAGDEPAWRRIFDLTQARLFNFLCYQTGDRDTARDLLQETYITAHGRLDTFTGRGSLHGWLQKVALRKCLDWRRRVKVRVRKMAAYTRETVSVPTATDPEDFPGLGDAVQAALDHLPDRQRAVLLLRELDDLPFAAIGETLGCSEATARVHHHRACRRMQQLIDENAGLALGGNTGGLT